jgi:hypothetical protein
MAVCVEAPVYEVEIRYTRWPWRTILLTLLAAGLSLSVPPPAGYFLAVGMLLLGAFLVWALNRSDREPQLKLSREGLWSQALGFRPWSELQLRILSPLQFRSEAFNYTLEIRDATTGKVLRYWAISRLDVTAEELDEWLLRLTNTSYL